MTSLPSNQTGEQSKMESITGELICGVCLEYFEEPLLLPCGHNFCKKCVYGIIENYAPFVGIVPMGASSSYRCPVCQKGFNSKSCSVNNLPKNKALESIISLHVAASPVDIFDTGWNADLAVRIAQCPKHRLPMEYFCRSCNLPACNKCEKEHHQSKEAHHRHKVLPIKDVANKNQAEIAEALTEIKKRSINLNERLKLLKSVEQQIETNEKSLLAELDHNVNAIMSAVRRKHEELKRSLQNDFSAIKKPFENELRRCNSLKTSIHEIMKKVSDIKRTVDTGLKISLMGCAKKQLNSLLCFDIAWSVKDHSLPTLALPSWRLNIQDILDCVGSLEWTKDGVTSKNAANQTDSVETIILDKMKESSAIYLQGSRASELKAPALTDSAELNIGIEQVETNRLSTSSTGTVKAVRNKNETKFGVDHQDFIDGKTKSAPKRESVFTTAYSLNLPEDVETDGFTNDMKITSTNSANTVHVCAETSEQRFMKQESTNLNKMTINLSPASSTHGVEVRPIETLDLIRSLNPVLPNESKEPEEKVTDNEGEKRSGFMPATSTKTNTVVPSGNDYDLHSASSSGENSASVVEQFAKAGTRPKVIINDVKSNNNKPPNKDSSGTKDLMKDTSLLQETNRKNSEDIESELMDVSFDDYNDTDFLAQSLDRVSFQAKSEGKADHRNSFPPDTLPSNNRLTPRSQPFHKFEKPKPKQRSPHQAAVAKFVERRRTASPNIRKTASSQNFSTPVEFPKTLSSPALTEFSAAKETSSELNGKKSSRLLTKNDKGAVLIKQGHLYPEKPVSVEVSLGGGDEKINSNAESQNEWNENIEAQKHSPQNLLGRKILKVRRSAEKK